ncbi:hypothetical protein BC831DRAFT_247665 [Entophlyctis helioformis]|nr:hypothetical protein BC831DRAFT_247665 [Entophlyctis helioformis]
MSPRFNSGLAHTFCPCGIPSAILTIRLVGLLLPNVIATVHSRALRVCASLQAAHGVFQRTLWIHHHGRVGPGG